MSEPVSGHPVASSTIPPDPQERWDRREQALRTVATGVVGAIVAAAAFGLLGVRTATVEARGAEYTLEVRHAAITRPGLATPFAVTVGAVDGSLPESLTLRVESGYLEMFDENGLDPEPSSSTADSRWVWWTFADSSGRPELTVSFDARLEPATQRGETATVAVEVEGEEVVAAEVTTWVLP